MSLFLSVSFLFYFFNPLKILDFEIESLPLSVIWGIYFAL